MENLKQLFGNRLKKIRKSKKLTQEELAEKLDVSLPSISYIENGKTYPSVETQEKLCKVLDIKFHELYMFEELPTNEEMKSEIITALNNKPELIKKIYNFYKFI